MLSVNQIRTFSSEVVTSYDAYCGASAVDEAKPSDLVEALEGLESNTGHDLWSTPPPG